MNQVFNQEEVETVEDLTKPWKVIILNDNITPFDFVILGLVTACKVSQEVAECIALEAHNSGQAIAKAGVSKEQGEGIIDTLVSITSRHGFPGINCLLEREE